AGPYEERAATLLKDPWAARDHYISVILDRDSESMDRFFAERATHELTDEERTTVWKLLEIQRHAMLMYTSCGWFFDELSGIETVQVIMYAGRAIQLAREVLDRDFETEFLKRLALARSNVEALGNGARIYNTWVKPAALNLPRVAAHFAISSLFDHGAAKSSLFA